MYLFQVSIRCAEEADGVLLRRGDGHRSEERVAVGERWRTVDGHDAGDLQSDLAEIVNIARGLQKKKKK